MVEIEIKLMILEMVKYVVLFRIVYKVMGFDGWIVPVKMAGVYFLFTYLLHVGVACYHIDIALYIFSAVIVAAFTKKQLVRCVVTTFLILAMQLISEVMGSLLLGKLGIEYNAIVGSFKVRLIWDSISLFTIYMFIEIFGRKVMSDMYSFSNSEYKNRKKSIALMSLCVFIGFILFMCSIFMNNIVENVLNDRIIIFRASVVIVILLIVVSVLMFSIIRCNRDEDEVRNRRNLEKLISRMSNSVEALRIQKHDFMNHLQVVLMHVSSNNTDSAKEYILGLSDKFSVVEPTISTGNNCVDAVLNIKKIRAAKHGIDLTECIDIDMSNLRLSDADLASLIFNIVDNAIDELKTMENNEYKYVHIDAFEDDEYYNVSIKNNGAKLVCDKKIFERGFSSKGDGRGYGLYYIKKVINENGCKLVIDSDDIETDFTIKIPKLYN